MFPKQSVGTSLTLQVFLLLARKGSELFGVSAQTDSAVCTCGGCGAAKLAGGGNGLFGGSATNGIGGGGLGLVGYTAPNMDLHFLYIWL